MRLISKMYSIYILTEPDGITIRYVGITKIDNLKQRLSRHICDARNKKENNHRCCWLRSLELINKKPCIRLIEKTNDPLRERFWIYKLRSEGINLTNSSDGCESHIGYIQPISVRLAISKAKSGKPISVEHRAALIKSLIGRQMSEHNKEILRKYNTGRFVSAETRNKMADAKRGKPNWSKGIPKPLAQRIKISETLKNRARVQNV